MGRHRSCGRVAGLGSRCGDHAENRNGNEDTQQRRHPIDEQRPAAVRCIAAALIVWRDVTCVIHMIHSLVSPIPFHLRPSGASIPHGFLLADGAMGAAPHHEIDCTLHTKRARLATYGAVSLARGVRRLHGGIMAHGGV